MRDLWVFGYGSLMWRPGFEHIDMQPARIRGWHRALCIYSWVHRGTEAKPGLVLGLDRGGAARGLAFRVPAVARDAVVAYLREREQVTAVYREIERPVELVATGESVGAITYVVDRSHPQYAGRLPREDLLRFVRQGHGMSGPNADYVIATVDHMRQLGIRDPDLEWLASRLSQRPGHSEAADVEDVE